VVETGEIGLSLLDFLVNKDWAIIVDSVATMKKPVGHIHKIDCKNWMFHMGRNPHNMGIGEVLYLGYKLNLGLPDKIVIMAMEVRDNHHFGGEMTPEVNVRFERFLVAVLEGIKRCTSMASRRV
jgi:hydrogenase maturation protease